jgi:ABC-type transporter Mla MlaB component
MWRFYFFTLVIIAFSLIVPGCGSSGIKPSSSGKSGELLIVMDSVLWKSVAGDILRDSLQTPYPALPQYESIFKLINVHPSGFKNILQSHRNVLMVETGPLQHDQNYALTFKRDVWASPQMVMNLRATDVHHLESAVLSLTTSVINGFTAEEKSRLVKEMRKRKSNEVSEKIKSSAGITIPFTDDFFVAKNFPGYIWVRKETAHTSIGFQVLRIPYESELQFSPDSIVALRDSISKSHIPGPSAGSYMTTDKNFPASIATATIDSSYSVEIRGLWRTEGDFMGGPFISYLVLDQKKNELIFLDAYVYAPKFNKREYMKQLEAIAQTAKL